MRLSSLPPLFLLFLLALAGGAGAQPPGPQRFRVESVVVGGVLDAGAREIVAAQSLLVPGREYSEEEIRHAVFRVKRLPFVLDAELTLRAGKETGGTEVLIGVVPNRALFASVEVSGTSNADSEAGDDRTDVGASALGGGRWFLGSLGLVSARLQGFDGFGVQNAQVGYSRYGLFGRGGAVTLTLGSDVGRSDDDFLNASLLVDLPLVGDHSFRTTADWSQVKSHGAGFRHRFEAANLAVAWVFDTTDDPLFPTAGRRATGGAHYSDSKQTFRGGDFASEDKSHGYGLDLAARRHWALTARQSLSAEVNGRWDRSTLTGFGGDLTQSSASLKLGAATDLVRRRGAERFADIRWENGLQVLSNRSNSPFGRERRTDASLSTGLALRNSWGLLRLNFSYVDTLSRDSRFNASNL